MKECTGHLKTRPRGLQRITYALSNANEEIDNDLYDVFFGPVLIGRYDFAKGAILSRRSNYSYNLDYEMLQC
jgi:hypothetical protein